MKLYIDVKNPMSGAHAKRVDEQFSGNEKLRGKLDYAKERRYGSGTLHDNFIHHQEWIDYVSQHCWELYEKLKGTDQDHLLDKPLDRCPVYVGLGKSVVQRSKDHSNHAGTISPILGLLCAVFKLRYGEVFQTTTSTWQILKTVHTSHIGLDERVTTVLCSAYPWDGGLSTAYAGMNRGQPNKYDDRDHEALQQNIEDIELIELIELQTINLEESDRRVQIFGEQFRGALKYESEHEKATAEFDSFLEELDELRR